MACLHSVKDEMLRLLEKHPRGFYGFQGRDGLRA